MFVFIYLEPYKFSTYNYKVEQKLSNIQLQSTVSCRLFPLLVMTNYLMIIGEPLKDLDEIDAFLLGYLKIES